MTTVSDWFSQKMGARPAAPPQQRIQYTPQAYQQQPVYQQQPQQFDTTPPIVQLTAQGDNVDRNQLLQLVREGELTVKQASRWWKGNRKGATGTEHHACPECGGVRYFERKNTRLMNESGAHVSPSPICWDCGYNGIFDKQYGVVGEPGGHVEA